MAGARRDHAPRPLWTKTIGGGGDVDGLAPREAVVGAAHVERAHVFHAVNEVHTAIAVGDRHGVVDGLLPRIADHLAGRLVGVGGIAGQARPHVGDLPSAIKRAATIGAAAPVDLDLSPVETGKLARLAKRQDRAPRRDDEARDAVGNKPVGLFRKKMGFNKQGRGGKRRAPTPQRRRERKRGDRDQNRRTAHGHRFQNEPRTPTFV